MVAVISDSFRRFFLLSVTLQGSSSLGPEIIAGIWYEDVRCKGENPV